VTCKGSLPQWLHSFFGFHTVFLRRFDSHSLRSVFVLFVVNMTLPTKEQKYSPLKVAYADLEDDSDTTLGSTEFLGKRTKRRKRHCQNSCVQYALTWFRWGSVVVLQSIILVLLLQNIKSNRKPGWTETDTETGGDVNGLYVPCEGTSRISQIDRTNSVVYSITQIHIAHAK
jgi:hypothetical protein